MERSFGCNDDTYLLMYRNDRMLMKSPDGDKSLDVFLEKVVPDEADR